MMFASRSFLKSALLFACAVSAVGCNSNVSPESPDFWDIENEQVYAKLTIDQEKRAGEVVGNIMKLLALAEGNEDVSDLGMYRGSDATVMPVATDTQAAERVTTDCLRREQTIGDSNTQIGTVTRKIWFESREGSTCPVMFALEERSERGVVKPMGDTTGILQSVAEVHRGTSFQINRESDLFNLSEIRSIRLDTTSEMHRLNRTSSPTSVGHNEYVKSSSGMVVLRDGSAIGFDIKRSRDISETAIDNTNVAYAGREIAQIAVKMPYGAAVVAYETSYDGKGTRTKTKITVNGKVIAKM